MEGTEGNRSQSSIGSIDNCVNVGIFQISFEWFNEVFIEFIGVRFWISVRCLQIANKVTDELVEGFAVKGLLVSGLGNGATEDAI